MKKQPIMSGTLKDWRQRLHYSHPEFKPGFVLVDGVKAFYVDEKGQEHVTEEGMSIVCNNFEENDITRRQNVKVGRKKYPKARNSSNRKR